MLSRDITKKKQKIMRKTKNTYFPMNFNGGFLSDDAN
jgi:hypothetical protein